MSGAPAEAPSATAVVSLLDSDDDNDDIEVVSVVRGEVAPAAPVAQRSAVEDSRAEADGDVAIVGVLATAPVHPHLRENCRRHVFVAERPPKDAAQERNVLACETCFCYVCDVLAS